MIASSAGGQFGPADNPAGGGAGLLHAVRGIEHYGSAEPAHARQAGHIVGAVQLEPGATRNAAHRAEVQKLMAPAGKNLVARLVAVTDNGVMVDAAVWTVLGRAPEADERAYLADWVAGRKGDRAKACGELVWALVTSAEFRFNH